MLLFCFLTHQTQVQMLDYGQMTRKPNVSDVLFPSSPKQKGEKDSWLQIFGI